MQIFEVTEFISDVSFVLKWELWYLREGTEQENMSWVTRGISFLIFLGSQSTFNIVGCLPRLKILGDIVGLLGDLGFHFRIPMELISFSWLILNGTSTRKFVGFTFIQEKIQPFRYLGNFLSKWVLWRDLRIFFQTFGELGNIEDRWTPCINFNPILQIGRVGNRGRD